MLLLSTLVFIAVFGLAAFLFMAFGRGSKEAKDILARLNSMLVTDKNVDDEIIDIRKKEALSPIPLLNRILVALDLAPRLRSLLYQANLEWTPTGLLLMSLGCWLAPAYLIYLRAGNVWLSLILALVPAAIPLAYVRQSRAKRFYQFEQGLPAALDLMVCALRGGHSLISAVGLVGREVPDPICREFRACFDEQKYGLDLHAAMENLHTRVPIRDVGIIVTAILIQKETGGNLAEVLEKVAQIIRDRFRLKREIRTRSAQGRLTGWILTFLPVVLGLLLYLLNPEHMGLLWTHPLGKRMMWSAAVLMLCGGLTIRKIVRIRV